MSRLGDRDLMDSKPPAPVVAVLETLGATAGTVLIGHWLRPHDPFLVHEPFCWPVLAPLLMGLRYGFAYGFGCALLLTVAMAAAWRMHWVAFVRFPSQFGLGMLVSAMLAGEFADVWMRKVRRLSVISDFRRLRLDEFARAYHLLKVSHDTLEQRVVGSSQNLREALQTLRRQLTTAKEPSRPLLGLENAILQLFASYGFIQTAALFPVDERDRIGTTPVSSLGDTQRISAADPLLLEAIERRALVSVRAETSPHERQTDLLAAIPIADVRGRLWAIIAVQQMLFVAFQADNLKLLAVLGGHTGDILAYGAGWSSGEDETAGGFRQQLRRAVEDRRSLGLPGAVVSLVFAGTEQASAIVQQVIGQRRGLDQALVLRGSDDRVRVFLLLAVTDELGASGYLARLRRVVQERYGTDLAAAGVDAKLRIIAEKDQADALMRELARGADIAEEALLG
jgi:hypothetical protein